MLKKQLISFLTLRLNKVLFLFIIQLIIQLSFAQSNFGQEQEKYALLVGINDYTAAPLLGCVNDVNNMNKLLRDNGFTNVSSLTDSQATRSGILDKLGEFKNSVPKNSLFVFYYSGHGTLFPDSRSEEQDETEDISAPPYFPLKTKYDSALVPIDYSTSGSGKPWKNLILDDELFNIFSQMTSNGVKVVFISDSCHSGTLAKDIGFSVRFLPPEKALGLKGDELTQIPRPVSSRSVSREITGLYLTITSSQDTQTSIEYDNEEAGQRCGLFTYVFCKNLRSNPTAPINGLFSSIKKEVLALAQGRNHSQEPSIEYKYFQAGLNKPLFSSARESVDTAKLRVVVRIADTSGNALPNSIFAIIKPGVKDLKALTPQDTYVIGKTNEKGIFDSDTKGIRIAPGTYLIKATRDGYQTFIGELPLIESQQQAGTGVLSIKLAVN